MVLRFVADALAQQQGGEPGWAGLVIPLAIFAFFYFLFIYPQQKRSRERKQMLASLKEGMEVVTTGGVVGRIVELDETFAILEVAPGVRIPIQRTMVAAVLPKGTVRALEKKFSSFKGGTSA